MIDFDFGFMNPEQIEAVKHKNGPCRVIAGAGSGKTKVLTERIHYLMKVYGISPKNILAITFTKKAAGEMQERLISLVGDEGKEVFLGTFHRFGLKLIYNKYKKDGKSAPKLLSDLEQKQILQNILSEATNVLASPLKSDIDVDTALGFISWQKNYLIMPNDELDTSCLDETTDISDELIEDLRTVYKNYEKLKKQADGIDFDDMLVEAYWILKRDNELRQMYQNKYKYILVDEFQDTNVAQYKLIKLLASGYYHNVFIVGDARQAIYSWRASKVDFILNFEKDWKNARTIELNDNYRSTVEVVDMSTLSIKHSEINYPGICRSGRGNHGSPIFSLFSDDENMEAESIAHIIDMMVNETKQVKYSDIAILYRLNAQSRPFEDAFTSNNIPFYVAGSPGYYGRREIQELLSYLKLAVNPNDFDSFKNIINVPNRNVSKDDLVSLQANSIKYQTSILDTVIGFADKYKSTDLLRDFGLTLQKIQRMNEDDNYSVADILFELCENSGYYDFLRERMKGKMKTKADEDGKIESLKSFLSSCSKFKNIDKLFEHIQKVNEQQDNNQKDRVQLMSLHRSKGLEFNTVFMVGMINGLLPHNKSMKVDGNGKIIPASIEEERRLCYVGITRAKETLFLSSYHNQGKNPAETSIFLQEIYPHTKDFTEFANDVKKLYEAKIKKEEIMEKNQS